MYEKFHILANLLEDFFLAFGHNFYHSLVRYTRHVYMVVGIFPVCECEKEKKHTDGRKKAKYVLNKMRIAMKYCM